MIPQKAEELIIIPLYSVIIAWTISIIKQARLKIKIGKYDSEEQFENKFVDLVKRDKSKKVIFVDDLDRCSKEKVVKTLETIKTFLDVETCIFIIACDDEIIKDAINRAHELYRIRRKNEGSEYLEKFFQYTLHIPPFMIPDMRKYVKRALERNKSDLLKLGETLEVIIFILINTDVQSPRNAITVMNEFASVLLLAQKREAEEISRLHQKIITNNLPTLAVVTAIRLHFPEFHRDLLRNNDLVFWLIKIRRGNVDQLNERQLEACKKYFLETEKKMRQPSGQDDDVEQDSNYGEEAEAESKLHLLESEEIPEVDWSQARDEDYGRLFDFLESVKDDLTAEDLTPFLYLSIDDTSYLIGDEHLYEFNDALKNGIESRIERILTEADEDKKEHLFDHMINSLQDTLVGAERRKALQILSKQLSRCPDSKIRQASRMFYSRFYNANMGFEEYKRYSPVGIFASARRLDGEHRQNLLSQSFDFLEGVDIEHDKLVLDEIFKNEDIIDSDEICKKVRAFVDQREPFEDSGEPSEPRGFLDYEYVKNKIIEFDDSPELLMKFFSGNIINEVIDHLVKADAAAESSDDRPYLDARRVLEILRQNILQHDQKKLCDAYKKLVETELYYFEVLDDIEARIDEIPNEEVDALGGRLLKQISACEESGSIRLTLKILYRWLGRSGELAGQSLTDELKSALVELSLREDGEIWEISTDEFSKFQPYFSEEQMQDLLGSFISLMDPQGEFDKARKLRHIITENKDSLAASTREILLAKLLEELNSVERIRNSDNYDFWVALFDEVLEVYQEADLNIIVRPNDNSNILSVHFPGANQEDRSRLCHFINISFSKISQGKQDDYFELFRPFLSNVSQENAQYVIKNIHPVHVDFKNSSTLASNIDLFLSQFDAGLDDSSIYKNVEIIYSCRQELSHQQISQTLEHFSICANLNPEHSIHFLSRNWGDFEDASKIHTLKALLSTDIVYNLPLRDGLFSKIKEDFEGLPEETISEHLERFEAGLKETGGERTFCAELFRKISDSVPEPIKNNIKSTKIDEIKGEPDIDLCRNKFSLIIAFKTDAYDRDKEVNDLFFTLLYDSKERKKLALDVFEFYYEGKHPHNKKGELTERFNNLMDELDGDYKNRIKGLAQKYDLKVKKSFLETIFGS
jgi:hypothetical protein